MNREKLILTPEQAREIIWGDSRGFRIVVDESIGHGRWSVYHRIVIQRISDGKYFSDKYSVGATESQDEKPFEYQPPNFIEVFPVEKTIIVYE